MKERNTTPQSSLLKGRVVITVCQGFHVLQGVLCSPSMCFSELGQLTQSKG